MENFKDKILTVIQENYNTFKGTNEAELQSSEDITEIVVELMDSYADDVMRGCNLKAKEWIKKSLNKLNDIPRKIKHETDYYIELKGQRAFYMKKMYGGIEL